MRKRYRQIDLDYAIETLRRPSDLLPAAHSSGTIARCALIRLTYTEGCACEPPHPDDDECSPCTCPCHEFSATPEPERGAK